MNKIFKPVRPRRLSDGAIEQIKRLVAEGRLVPGDRLPPERELMELLSVSRTSLREAIRTLETMGVLRVVPGRGTYVCEREKTTLAEDWYMWLLGHRTEVVQILEVHEALEVKVAELATTRISTEQVSILRLHFEEMERAVLEEDHEALVAADAAFHRTIREAGGNEVMERILNDLEDNVLDARRAVMALPSRVKRVVADHGAILDAIGEGRPERAALMTLQHIVRSKDELLRGEARLLQESPAAGSRV